MDLEAISRGFAQHGNEAGLPGERATLLVFVSFAMPDATLSRLVDQVSKARGTLVLRGLVNGSVRETAARVRDLLGTRRVPVQVDPQAFDRHSVVRTPSFVLASGVDASKPCPVDRCPANKPFLLASGDVSLGYALRHMASRAPASASALRREAAAILHRLGEAP
ncbi:type-F conjugative transfer system pilin assembly protein TrbC [Aquabacterium humicola]|uniref:type-F conjugative transfer system pilin assembly protein TrbC n=1 Tax=Aquabacterium humicola TaxID=3237377 RepID=UPI002542DBB1|nr:type-F conjugative transfer system pilin assembly protein TrbC [Rubrivivax pictus]